MLLRNTVAVYSRCICTRSKGSSRFRVLNYPTAATNNHLKPPSSSYIRSEYHSHITLRKPTALLKLRSQSRQTQLHTAYASNLYPLASRYRIATGASKELPARKGQNLANISHSYSDLQSSHSSNKGEPVSLPVSANGTSQVITGAELAHQISIRRQVAAYLSLSKPRLTFLMVLTTASAYSLYPVPTLLSPVVTESPSLSALTLVYLTAGTGFCSASANSLNMMMEPEHDAKMSRTRNRPIVRGVIGKRAAFFFALAAGIIGVVGLYMGVNPTVSFLGGLNILLYAGVYTPLKRISVINTWVGAVVGAIPPLMGWAAAAGQTAAVNGNWEELLLGKDAAGGWLLATLLFSWQFHHFNALSWTIRYEYQQAGYRMLAWVNEKMNARIALRYALLCFPACWGLSIVGVTNSWYLLTSSLVNMWIARAAWRFYVFAGRKGSARGLFWAGVWQLPSLMVLAMAQKRGLWEGLWYRVMRTNLEESAAVDESTTIDENGLKGTSQGRAASHRL